MAKSAKTAKIVLSLGQDIPLDRLAVSTANVRHIKAGISIESLADDIARRGLLQSLSVRADVDESGADSGTYRVQAGGRRLRALQLLVKQKRLAKDAPIPCIVAGSAALEEEDSLAENTAREALHPLDQFRAFAALAEKGQGDETIAATFGVTPAVVRQRLRMADASPTLLAAYADDKLTLEQLMAFCARPNHARQEQVFAALPEQGWQRNPPQIRAAMIEDTIDAEDRRAVFVTVEAYEAAGGVITRDLFDTDAEGYLEDAELLNRLVAEKLEETRATVLTQGWKWAEAALDFDYTYRRQFRRLPPVGEALTPEEQTHYEAISEEYEGLVSQQEDDDDVPDIVTARIAEIEAELTALDDRPPQFSPDQMACAGALISVTNEGRLQIDYGLARAEDLPDARPGRARPDAVNGHDVGDFRHSGSVTLPPHTPLNEDDDGIAALSDKMVQELTAHRTVALRNALADDPEMATLVLLHALVLAQFYRAAESYSCLRLQLPAISFPTAAGLADAPYAKAIDARHDRWSSQLPEDPQSLWDTLRAFDGDSRASLQAHCVSLALSAIAGGYTQPGARQSLRHADALAAALDLNMREAGWEPTVDTYLGRVTKPLILDAVREAKGDATAQLLEHLKKAEMAKEAERLLADTTWLPVLLQTSVPEPAIDGQPDDTEVLPAFLSDDGLADHPEALSIAAE